MVGESVCVCVCMYVHVQVCHFGSALTICVPGVRGSL
jgi:hypothetical protein